MTTRGNLFNKALIYHDAQPYTILGDICWVLYFKGIIWHLLYNGTSINIQISQFSIIIALIEDPNFNNFFVLICSSPKIEEVCLRTL